MKKTISFILVLIMLFTLMPLNAFAETNDPMVSVENSWGQPGSIIDVNVSIKNNPGIATTKLSFTFSDELTLIGYKNGAAFSELSITAPAELKNGEMHGSANFTWYAADIDEIKDGTVLTLKFRISEDSVLNKDCLVSVTAGSSALKDRTKVNIKTENGYATIIDYVPGDVDMSGEVDMIDVLVLCQYIVDDLKFNPKGYDIAPSSMSDKEIQNTIDLSGEDINLADVTRIDEDATNVDMNEETDMIDVLCICQYIVDDCKTNPKGYNITLYPNYKPCVHEMEHFPANEPTCTEDGNIEYWYCAKCDKYYTDVDGKGRIAPVDTVIAAAHTLNHFSAKAATKTEPGNIEYWQCKYCDKYFADEYGSDEITLEDTVVRAEEYEIKYYSDGGIDYLKTVGVDNPNDHTYLPETGLILKEASATGFEFQGWYDGSGANATQIKKIEAGTTGTIELYAHWTEQVYDITYNVYNIPVTISPTVEQAHYTVSKGNYNLVNPEINNYKFLGWYDNKGVEYRTIPVGTTGDIVLNAYYTSLRNLAISKEDNNPIIVEDQNSNVVYFTYEIGEIRNIPLNGDNPFWTIQSVAGLSQQKSDTYTTSITDEEAKSVSKAISDMTVNSSTWTLAETWNDVTTVNDTWAETIGKETEQCRTEATTSSNTLSVSDQMGGSSYHRTEDGTTVYDYDSKTVTNDKGHQFDVNVNGRYAQNKGANFGESNEYGTEVSYKSDNAYTQQGKINSDNWSASGASSGASSGSAKASDKDKYSSGFSYEKGFEVNGGLKYGYYNNTNTVTHTGSDSITVNSNIDENTGSWNSAAAFSSTQQHSSSQSIRNKLSDIVTTTKEYGKSYSKGGSDTSTQGFSSTSSNTSGTTSAVTYSKIDSHTTTTTYSVDGKIEGSYRCILVGKAHVFGVVGYDYNTKSYFTYTFSVMDDKEEEFLDYTPKGGDFTDCEFSCLPFEIPSDVFDYVNERTVKTTGIQYRTDSINGTARITGYVGSDADVIVPSYVSDGKQAYKVTEIASSAFAGKPVRAVVLGEFIESIPNGAFKDCTKLEEVIGSFTEIGDEAFSGCGKLTNMNIPSNVVKIGEDAFLGANSINVRAINSLSAYAKAAKVLPDGTDEQIEAKQKEITQEFIKSVLDCGAENIIIDLSNIVEGTTLTLDVPEINSIEISGGTKTYNNFSINSSAKNTTLNEMTINNTHSTPLTVDSDKLTLHKVFVTGKTTALILKNDGAILSLDQDSTIKSTSKYAVIGKNPVVESLLSKDGAAGFLNVVGNFGYVNSIEGEDYIDFTDGELIEISEEEFEKYVQGACSITFDANGGKLEEGSESTQVMLNETIADMPTPTRDYYTFDGWYTEAEGGEKIDETTPITTVGGVTLYAHWNAAAYTATWVVSTGTSITVSRTSSPNANAETGTLKSGAPIYYGDVLSVKYAAKTGYTLAKNGETSITVTGNVTKVDIYANANPKDYPYNVVYKSSNGTELGSDKVKKAFGTTNTITAPAKAGYVTPDPQSVKWDSTTAKTITFIYTPKSVSTSRQAASGWWWHENSYGISYNAYVEYQNRTASSVQIRIKWVQTIQNCFYGYNQWFYASCGGQNTGSVKITPASTWASVNHNESRTVDSNWMTVPVSATATSVSVACDWWTDGPSHKGSWGFDMPIPTY